MLRQRLRFTACRCVAFAITVAATTVLLAHDIPANLEMNAFFKVDANQAHLIIRIPLYLVRPADLPSNGREIDIASAGAAIARALNGIDTEIAIRENGTRLVSSGESGRLSLPSDRSFESYEQASAHVSQPTPSDTTIYYDQGYFDAHLIYPIGSPHSRFTLQTRIAPELGDHVKLILRYLPMNESSRAMIISPRSGRVSLNPAWYQAAAGFVGMGISHILSGADHLLFLLCLVIPFRRLRGLLAVITAFTVAHSVTLILSAYDLAPKGAWFPPFVETAIAASIVYMALENIVNGRLDRRWVIAGLFGLVHGFGFSYALRQELQFAGQHLLVSLLSFNIGIEIGQVAVLGIMLAGLALLFRTVLRDRRIGVIVLSAIVAHTAWHWMVDRGRVLAQAEMPVLDAHSVVIAARWVAAILIAIGVATMLAERFGRKPLPRPQLTDDDPQAIVTSNTTATAAD